MEINEYLIKLIGVIKDMESLDFFAGNVKLSKTEFRLIREIVIENEKGNKIISSELARRLGITRSAVSQLVTKMEKSGVVERVDSPTDRKIAYVQLSPHAFSVFEEQCTSANAVMQLVVEELGQEKIDTLLSEYEKFSAALAEACKKVSTEKNA